MSQKKELRQKYRLWLKNLSSEDLALSALQLNQALQQSIVHSLQLFTSREEAQNDNLPLIAAYRALPDEVDLLPTVDFLFRQASESKGQAVRIAFPKVEGEDLRFFEWIGDPSHFDLGKASSQHAPTNALTHEVTAASASASAAAASPSVWHPHPSWGILEPNSSSTFWRRLDTSVLLQDLRVILVPGLAFDRTGARLGRGRGFYDRTLNVLSQATAGLLRVGVALHGQVQTQPLPVEQHDVRMSWIQTDHELLGPFSNHYNNTENNIEMNLRK